ncbi:hypothetical protein ACOJVU_04950 [Mycobacterium sp. THU-M104]|uniref:hypothetical protein n=1 Tax=Mycobacterium sp. THU-M104 TaxID=3410515 RepID=UPI003B9988F9
MTSFGSNVDSLLSALPLALSDYMLVSPLYALGSGVAALAEVVQETTQAQDAGDQTLALTDLSNAPAAIVDGFLNGYNGPDSDLFHGTPYGLLTYAGGPNGPDGTFQLLLDAEGDLAEEIKPFTAPASAAVSPLEFSVSSAQLAGALDGFDTAALLDAGHLSADVGGIFGQLAADLGAIASGLIS